MSHYRFVSTWATHVPPERCWSILERSLRDGRIAWWPQVEIHGVGIRGADGGGTVRVEPDEPLRMRVRSPLGYALEVELRLTEVEAPRRLAARSRGDLDGGGTLDIHRTEDGSDLVWTWTVTPRRRWMRVTGPLLRPAFAAAHTAVMRRGERGFRRAVGA